MSRSGLIGALGLGRQSAKGTPAASYLFPPVTSVGLNINQNVSQLPPEVGGSYFLRGSYKGSVAGGGDIGMIVRPNSIGAFFYMLAGVDTVTTVNGAPQHVFTPFAPQAGVDLPWFTFLKDVSKLYGEQYLDSKLASLTVDVSKSQIPTAQASVVSVTPSSVSVSGNSINGITESFDTSPNFQSCIATVSLTQEGGGNISANSVIVDRFRFSFGNRVSNDEFAVGSYYLQDVTLLQRTASVDLDYVVRDTALYQAVYQNGNAIPGAWQPTIYRGTLTVTLTSASGVYIPGSTNQLWTLTFNFPGLDFLAYPVPLNGADLVRTTLSTMVTLGSSGSDMFTITLNNSISSY